MTRRRRKLAGAPPTGSLDPALRALLAAEGLLQPPDLAGLGLERALAALRAEKPRQTPPLDQTADTEDLYIPGPAGGGIPIRVYRPPGAGPSGLLLHFHGGGWVGGSISNDELRCHVMCRRGNLVMVSVAYRLAPEHKFPAGLEDAYAALCWARTAAAGLGADPFRIGLSGASAGANLAFAAALRARDENGPALRCLVLAYPVCDTSLAQPSHRENATAPLLSSAMMAWFIAHYLPERADPADPRIAILRSKNFAGLPPSLIITAGCDPLRDEAEELAQRLTEAGVHTEYACYDGMMHGFLTRAANLLQARAAMTQIVNFTMTCL